MQNICPKCAAPQREGAKFCNMCGERLGAPQAPRFCDECGAKLTPGVKFCDECGATISAPADASWTTAEKTDISGSADAWGDALVSLNAAEEEEKLALFEYEKRPDGSVVITGLKDKYALTVTVPEGVTVIADSAFRTAGVYEVALSEGLSSIEAHAFSGCESLTKINLPSSLIKIGDEAFSGCSKLELEIPDSVRILGESVLSGTKTERLKEEAAEEAERLKAERIAHERAEAEERERSRLRAEARKRAESWSENANLWTANLSVAGDPYDRTNPKEYGFRNFAAYRWLEAKASNYYTEEQKREYTLAHVVIAKMHFFRVHSVFDNEYIATAVSWLKPNRCHIPEYLDGFISLAEAMKTGKL